MTSTPASASARTRSRSTPPETSTTARPAIAATAARTPSRSMLSSRMTVDAGGERLLAPGRATRPRPRASARGRAARARASTAGRDAAGGADVVVLDHGGVEEAEAVRQAAAVHHGRLLEDAQPRRRLARGGDARPRAGRLGDEGGRQRGDAREPREEVEPRALQGQDARPAARRRRPACRRARTVAVAQQRR